MIVFLLLLFFVSQTIFGADVYDKENKENLQSILEELNTVKNKLKEIDYLKERTLSLENEVEDLKRQNKHLNQKVEELESRCAEHNEEDVKSATSVRSTYRNSAEVELESKFNKQYFCLKREQSVTSRQLFQRHIAFTAGVSAHNLRNLGVNQTIIFDKVITNIGNAYNNFTGILTVPVKGAYEITLTVTVEPSQVQWLELVVDGINITFISAGIGGPNNYASSTKQWILELHTGTDVWFRKGGGAEYHDLHGNLQTIVSGYLLFQT